MEECLKIANEEEPCVENCTESDALQILKQFECLYQGRVEELDARTDIEDDQRDKLKLQIMSDWVRDLGDQNTMLVQTVHDLEQAAVCRVKLLEDKLQSTTNIISQNMANSNKSEEDLNALSNRVCQLVNDQELMQSKIEYLQNDISSLLEVIKRGKLENNWSLDGITFCEIKPSDVSAITECVREEIANVSDKEKCLEIENLQKQLKNSEARMKKIIDEYDCKIYEYQKSLKEKCEENKALFANIELLEKETCETRDALTQEVLEKHEMIMSLNTQLKDLEVKLQNAQMVIQMKDDIIRQMRNELKSANQKVTTPVRKVTINAEPCHKLENNVAKDELCDKTKQINDLKSLLELKNNEISRLKSELTTLSQTKNEMDESILDNKSDILPFLLDLMSSTEKEKETIHSLKEEYEIVLENLKQTKTMYENDAALANEKIQDILHCLHVFKSEVIDKDTFKSKAKDFLLTLENKISYVHKLFQNQCKVCVKENLMLKLKEIISKVTPSILKLSGMYESKIKTLNTIKTVIQKQKDSSHVSSVKEKEQTAVFTAIVQQFRMMEEFRICTVEVQAATEDLREEITGIISNLNERHCRYTELNKMVNQVQDYLSKTKDNLNEVMNCLQLQNEDRARHNERITNNRIRLKDIKNEFNNTQSDLLKCLNNVHNNIQQNNLLGYSGMHTCNDLLTSVVEEVEQIINNLQLFQSNDCNTMSKITELNRYLLSAEQHVKELKCKSEQILKDNEGAQKAFVEKEKLLEKFECEIDACHTKMQDALQNIIDIRDQLNEYGCIKECADSHQSTNDLIKLKSDLRKKEKECGVLKQELLRVPKSVGDSTSVSEWKHKVIDLEDQLKVLQSENKCKQEANIHLKRSLEVLEKELEVSRSKSEEYRRGSSSECFGLKKKIFELENSIRVQKDNQNNFKSFANSDSKKSKLLDCTIKDNVLRYGVQGKYENVTHMFKILQEVIQSVKKGLQEFNNDLKRLVPEGSSNAYSTNHLVKTISEKLNKHIESIKSCYFEVEKVKTALYSKEKLMENMDKIIQIQKDSITTSQSEVEELHKTLQEKLVIQEREIRQHEIEKNHLNKQIELQLQTIDDLQEAILEAKHTIDVLTNKAANDVSEQRTTVTSSTTSNITSSVISSYKYVHDV